MLSRVAERIYWAARYLDRIENTARLVDVYHKLMLDLPPGTSFNWYALIALGQSEKRYKSHYKNKDEKSIIKFLLGDRNNPSSITSSLTQVRENIRTTRDVLPEYIWVLINEMSYFVEQNIHQGVNRGQRVQFLDGIIHGCFQINGLLQSTMPHDDAWYFMQMGRMLERADMTTRLLDAGARIYSFLEEQGPTLNSNQIVWANVLLSLGAHQPYRRSTRSSVDAEKVIHYLLEDPHLPSSIAFCISSIHLACEHLPQRDAIIGYITKIEKTLFKSLNYNRLDTPFRHYLDKLQAEIASIHEAISDNWFPVYKY